MEAPEVILPQYVVTRFCTPKFRDGYGTVDKPDFMFYLKCFSLSNSQQKRCTALLQSALSDRFLAKRKNTCYIISFEPSVQSIFW